MSNYLRRRFPLDDTSTVYMSGKAVYNLVRWNKPGIITSIELFPVVAEEFRNAVREAMEAAWYEGYGTGVRDETDGTYPATRSPYSNEAAKTIRQMHAAADCPAVPSQGEACNCATFGSAALCSHHTQADYESAERARDLAEHLEYMADSLDEHVTHRDIHRLLIESLDMARGLAESLNPSQGLDTPREE